MKVSISKRMTLEEVCHAFFGDKELAKCVKGEYSPKDYIWQSKFKIRSHGRFLAYLLFNGVFDRESEKYVIQFIMKYKGRIFGRDIKFRKCVLDRFEELGFEYGTIHIIFSSLTNKQVYVGKEPVCCNRLLYKVLPTFEVGKHISVKCAHLDRLLQTYSILVDDKPVIDIQELSIPQMFEVLFTGNVYDYVLPFSDKLVLTGLLKVCISRWKLNFAIVSVREKLISALDRTNIPIAYKRKIIFKYDKCISVIKHNIDIFREQESLDECSKLDLSPVL